MLSTDKVTTVNRIGDSLWAIDYYSASLWAKAYEVERPRPGSGRVMLTLRDARGMITGILHTPAVIVQDKKGV